MNKLGFYTWCIERLFRNYLCIKDSVKRFYILWMMILTMRLRTSTIYTKLNGILFLLKQFGFSKCISPREDELVCVTLKFLFREIGEEEKRIGKIK